MHGARIRAVAIPALALVAVTMSVTTVRAAQETARDRVIAIENEYLRIRANAGPQETARFAVDTTGGDPSRSADDGKVLIYGSREPWTSYTTVLIDGTPHIFGGPSQRRDWGDAAATGLSAGPRAVGDRIEASARVGDTEVTQELGFARSPTTRVKDAALISYRITNRGDCEHAVGLRIMLDTMLGTNDGAALRAGDRAISTATQMAGADLPDYWQAFDSLSHPAVISQGTLRAPGLLAPDRLEMVDWGTLADSPWEFPFPTGADFTRRGEEAQDTAVALYWRPIPLKPGESRTYATLYGVGGVSLSPAQLSLGLSAPAEVDYHYEEARPFAVIAYVENSGGFASRETELSLGLSEGLALAEGAPAAPIGLLQSGQTKQAVWRVLPTGKVTGTLQIAVTVTSGNLESNRVTRDVIVNSPPQLAVELAAPERLSITAHNRYSPNPFAVRARVTNRGAQAGRNLVMTLDLPKGLTCGDGVEVTRVVDRIEPGKAVDFTWQVRALGMPTGDVPIFVKASAAGAKPVSERHVVRVPRLMPELRAHPADQVIPALTDGQPSLAPIAIKLLPARDFVGARVSVSYDPAVLEPLYVSRGEAFVEEGRLLSPWSAGQMAPGRISDIGGERSGAPALNAAEVTLFTVVFMVKQPGETAITLEPISVASGAAISELRVVNGRLSVQPAE